MMDQFMERFKCTVPVHLVSMESDAMMDCRVRREKTGNKTLRKRAFGSQHRKIELLEPIL